MKAFVAVTDREWFDFLREQPTITEVNFWQPSGSSQFRALQPGQPFLFKLHYPENAIVGGGFFATFSLLPVSLAWGTFGMQNGARTLEEMRHRVEHYREAAPVPHDDYQIGCIILADPFFLDERNWIPAPVSFSKNTVRGKGYDLRAGEGRALWEAVVMARATQRQRVAEPELMGEIFGAPTLFRPRLGQGAFRVAVTDAYGRRCSVTGEKTLPVLDAAHIRPVASGGRHEISNGLLFRSDIHTLFDRGYVTVTPNLVFRVSPRLKKDWQNGREYYALDGQEVKAPTGAGLRPGREGLEWHGDEVFLG
jgi:putative restriction endonuclease